MSDDSHRIKEILRPLICEILLQRPTEILKFVNVYARKHLKNKSSVDNKDSSEICDIASLTNRSTKQHKNSQKLKQRVPRNAVSAETYGKFNQLVSQQSRMSRKPEQSTCTTQERVEIASILKKAFIFKRLSVNQLQRVTKSISIINIEKEQPLVHEGNPQDHLYIVRTGTFCCYRNWQNQREQYIKKYTPSDIFGEICLLYRLKSEFSIICTETATVYRLSRNNFTPLIKSIEEEKKKKYDYILDRIQFLSGVQNDCRKLIADVLKEKQYIAGEYIFHSGQMIQNLYIVLEGKIQTENQGRILSTIETGNYFAESCLFKNKKRVKFDAKSVTSSIILSINGLAFKRVVGSMEDILQRNIKICKTVLKPNTSLELQEKPENQERKGQNILKKH